MSSPRLLVPGSAGGTDYTIAYDLANSQLWPYREKVIGFAFNSIDE